jgi:two-component system, OmpR family, alkaline phosphatase synthesis response regulator PhoP
MTSAQSVGAECRVLVVEDDRAMSVALCDGLASERFEVVCAANGEDGLSLANERKPDIVVLDVMLPRLSGLDVCRKLRAAGNDVPVIMLTARGQEADRVLGLKLGADDYITKPFSFMELVARIEAVLRRSPAKGEASTDMPACEFGEVQIDFRRHEATKGGSRIDLSPREFLLMAYLVAHRSAVVTRDQLLDAVWGYDNMPFTRTVDTHVAKLRKKIEDDPANPRYLITLHRLGYKFLG